MNKIFNINEEIRPLAYRLRPKKLEDFIGQENIIGKDSLLYKLLINKKLLNSIFWGCAGTGKTSLAYLIAEELLYEFEVLNATNSGISDIKKIADEANRKLQFYSKKTILFLDEIHRFNKAQQDILLEYIENVTFILIGATTENPTYSLNNALLSRTLIYKFEKLSEKDIKKIINNTLMHIDLIINEESKDYIAYISNGDARIAINYLELLSEIKNKFSLDEIKKLIPNIKEAYDKQEDKYNNISAFIKSIRGSNPDATIYWLGKMLHGGEDPKYIARRLMILASEDVGMANSQGLNMATNAVIASERIGMPEIRIILAHVSVYLAISTKSNSVYIGINKALEDIKNGKLEEVPKHLKDEFSNEYKYPHDFDENFIKQEYIKNDRRYYIPSNNKNENLIKDKLKKLWGWKYE